jgi:hypothetical protein
MAKMANTESGWREAQEVVDQERALLHLHNRMRVEEDFCDWKEELTAVRDQFDDKHSGIIYQIAGEKMKKKKKKSFVLCRYRRCRAGRGGRLAGRLPPRPEATCNRQRFAYRHRNERKIEIRERER